MTDKPVSSMTRAELEQELLRFREARAEEEIVRGRSAEISDVAREASGETAPESLIRPTDEIRLRRFLNDLGRLSARHGVWLEGALGGPLLHVRKDAAAGYIAWPAPSPDGSWEVDSYVSGATLDPDGVIIGDDHSFQGKAERARAWRKQLDIVCFRQVYPD